MVENIFLTNYSTNSELIAHVAENKPDIFLTNNGILTNVGGASSSRTRNSVGEI